MFFKRFTFIQQTFWKVFKRETNRRKTWPKNKPETSTQILITFHLFHFIRLVRRRRFSIFNILSRFYYIARIRKYLLMIIMKMDTMLIFFLCFMFCFLLYYCIYHRVKKWKDWRFNIKSTKNAFESFIIWMK